MAFNGDHGDVVGLPEFSGGFSDGCGRLAGKFPGAIADGPRGGPCRSDCADRSVSIASRPGPRGHRMGRRPSAPAMAFRDLPVRVVRWYRNIAPLRAAQSHQTLQRAGRWQKGADTRAAAAASHTRNSTSTVFNPDARRHSEKLENLVACAAHPSTERNPHLRNSIAGLWPSGVMLCYKTILNSPPASSQATQEIPRMKTRSVGKAALLVVIALASFLAAGASLAQNTEPPPIKMGLWQSETTSKMTGVENTPMARLGVPQTHVNQACMTPEKWKDDFANMQSKSRMQNCQGSGIRQDGKKFTVDEVCQDQNGEERHSRGGSAG